MFRGQRVYTWGFPSQWWFRNRINPSNPSLWSKVIDVAGQAYRTKPSRGLNSHWCFTNGKESKVTTFIKACSKSRCRVGEILISCHLVYRRGKKKSLLNRSLDEGWCYCANFLMQRSAVDLPFPLIYLHWGNCSAGQCPKILWSVWLWLVPS